MKKLFSLTLAANLVLGLCACNTSVGKENVGFRVGYGSTVTTPEEDLYLMGYGNDTGRKSQGVLTDLYATCVAITDAQGSTVLLYGLDMMKMEGVLADAFIGAISEATGVPKDNILLSASHSHSTPSLGNSYGLNSTYGQLYQKKLVEAAKAAMDDRAAAEIRIGSRPVDRMNFVRHYTTDTGVVIGDNFSSGGYSSLTGHTTQSDRQLQLVHFVRSDRKDIVMVNWQGHPTLSSTSMVGAEDKKFLVSADYVGICRQYIQEALACHVSFYLGASGNLNAYSRIKSENIDTDYKKYGKNLGAQVVAGLAELKPTEAAALKAQRTDFAVELPSGGDGTVELNVYTMGELAFASVSYEMFDTNGMTVKNESPFALTMMITMANGYQNYVPADNAFDYPSCYEVRSTRFVRGTGEAVAEELVRQLKEMKD
ncbi:MAG: neutral/alkaline non-lysosomal ceramidase N-terminal domain-containing protein [Oscillospiraceae bacterium]|nr:neutral/alkaline non-lysosomal ceramidase N-terminal domain-containing protein [Oscillospiraceae bacterium]